MIYQGKITDLKGLSGIYKITCVSDGRFYVGSSRNLYMRFLAHRGDLNRGNHCARQMQNAWNTHGAVAFRYEVLELCAVEQIISKEQHYLDTLKPYHNDVGFNTCPIAGENGGMPRSEEIKQKLSQALKGHAHSKETIDKIKATFKKNADELRAVVIESCGSEYRLVSPDGKLFEGRGINKFAQEMGLCTDILSQVNRGERVQYKGWSAPGTSRDELDMYRFRDPFGILYEIPSSGLAKFARENGLENKALYAVWGNRLNHHRGWCRADSDVYVDLIHEDTKEIVTVCSLNVAPFRRRFNIPRFKSSILYGERPVSYGWRLKEKSKC